jgi:hypothetical protein
VGTCFELEVASRVIRVEIICECTLDVARARVVSLDEVAVVAIHQANEIRQARRACRVQASTERRGRSNEVGDDVGQ